MSLSCPFSQINPLTSSFFCCLFSFSSHFSSCPIKPPEPQLNGARDLGRGPNPPLFYENTRPRRLDRLYTAPRDNRSNPQTLQMNGLQNADTHRHNGRTDTNRLLRNSFHNSDSIPHNGNGNDNPVFTRADAQNVSTRPNTQQQNPNVVIQGGAQQPAVHVNLNSLPQNAQNNNNAQMPTIHVNLNSYPTNSQQTQQDNSAPLTNTADNNPPQNQPGLLERVFRNRQENRREPFLTPGHIDTAQQEQPVLVPTGFTHFNTNNVSQRNANTQTYTQEPEPFHRDSGTHDPSVSSSSNRQMPWDRLRGTPAYPGGTLQRGQTSDTSDYTTHPPIRQPRTNTRPQPRPQSKTPPRRQDAASADRQRRSRSADLRGPDSRSVTQLEAAHHTQRSPRTQREGTHRDIRASPSSQIAPRQEATRNNNPQAIPAVSQQASVGRSAVSQGLMTQQGPTALLSADTRALADPNHLPQAHMAPQYRAEPLQQTPQGLGTQTQPVIQAANPPRQGGFAPVPQPNRNALTQAALSAHTQRAQTFQNRKEQTQAALFHPGPQTQNTNPVTHHPPTPPPVIPLEQFQAIPKKHTQHRSPARGPQPPKPPVNMPVAQRPQHVQQRHATAPGHHHHHHHHAGGQRHVHAHNSHPRQVSETQYESLKVQPTNI